MLGEFEGFVVVVVEEVVVVVEVLVVLVDVVDVVGAWPTAMFCVVCVAAV